jgi:hypothetical protein
MKTADPFKINKFSHKIASKAVGNVITRDHFIDMAVAFDKAKVPMTGRIAIVDGIAAATISKKVDLVSEISPYAVRIVESGVLDNTGMRFTMNIHGWDIVTTNYLPQIASFSDGTTTVSNSVPCLFMSVLSDQTRPMAGKWRRQPKVESERNPGMGRDEYFMRCRYGFGPQRLDTLGLVGVSSINY